MDDHDDTLGGTAAPCADWRATASHVHHRVGTMRRPNRIAVRVAAWAIRTIVMHAPGFAGAIACAMVYTETEAAMDALFGGSRETPGGLA